MTPSPFLHNAPGMVYVLRDPRTMAIRYVGFTTREVDRRVRGHVAAARHHRNKGTTGGNANKERWLLELDDAGLEPIADALIRSVDGWDGEYWEHRIMEIAERNGARLTNRMRSSQLADQHAELKAEGRMSKPRRTVNQVAKDRAFPPGQAKP